MPKSLRVSSKATFRFSLNKHLSYDKEDKHRCALELCPHAAPTIFNRTTTMNTKDLIHLGVPVGEPIKVAHEFIQNFIAQGNDGALLEGEIFIEFEFHAAGASGIST